MTTNQLLKAFDAVLAPHAIHKSVYYFKTCQDAHTYAERHGHPTTRIIHYGRGWAIQLRVSGPYVGSTQ